MWERGYKMHAYLYLKKLFPYVKNWNNFDCINDALDEVYKHHSERAKLNIGSSRMVVIGKDFVLKWNYDEEVIKEIGGCEEELQTYMRSLSSDFSYLLAPIFKIIYRDKNFYIMPRVHNIGMREHDYKKLKECVTEREWKWLTTNIGDIHSYNWGIENNYPVMIDYACRPSI